MWTSFKGLEDAELKRLATDLPATVLQCKATSSTTSGAYRSWKEWASAHNLAVFLVNEGHAVLYQQHLAETKCSKSAVEKMAYGIAWAHLMARVPSPTDSPIVRATLEGLKRKLAKPVSKKSPLTAQMLGAIAQDARKLNTLASLRLGAACLLAFAGFLRFDELANMDVCDVTIGQEFLKVANSPQPERPAEARRRGPYSEDGVGQMSSGHAEGKGVSRLAAIRSYFGNCQGKAERLWASGGLSHTRMAELLKEKLLELEFTSEEFSLHSLRSGGATAAAVAGVPDRLFKKHGHWRLENAKDGYIEDSLEQRLSVLRSLGLQLYPITIQDNLIIYLSLLDHLGKESWRV